MSLRCLSALLLAGVAGCGKPEVRVPPASPYASRSLSQYDAALRHYVVAGDSTVLDAIERSGPEDRLVRLLNRGLYLHRLGRYEASNLALQEAEALAEVRYTRSISQNVAAFMVNDRVLDYTPSALERAMIHYYGMVNYLALGNSEDALVEARRANAFLERYDRDNGGRRSYTDDALVQYVAGLLHWSGGDDNDALVSLRRAQDAFDSYGERLSISPPREFGVDLARLAGRVGVTDVAEIARDRYRIGPGDEVPPGYGEVLVVVENGFIAHRTEQKIYIPVFRSEKRAIATGSADSILIATANIMIRSLVLMNQASSETRSYLREYEGLLLLGATALDADLLSFAWASYEMEAHVAPDITVNVGGLGRAAVVVEDLSAIASRNYEEQKPRLLARMIARGLFKEVSATRVEAAATERIGAFAGILARIGTRTAATLSERADTRSWSLLPAEIRLARFTLPAGSHSVTLDVRRGGQVIRTIDLGMVEVRPNRLTVSTAFVTGTGSGNLIRFGAASRGVNYETPPIRNRR